MSENNTQRRTLVMFSGGKDSFLTAARCAVEGDFVGLISFNNGCVRYEKHLAHGATRLLNRFGVENMKFEGIYGTGGTIWALQKWYVEQPLQVLTAEMPDVPPVHLACLHCQTAMWIAAIAFARAKRYDRICSGYLSDDEFCTGTIAWTDAMKELARFHGIDVSFPVWNNSNPQYPWRIARDLELSSMCFVPQVLEPQCMIGMPAPIPARQVETQLRSYYDRHLKEFALQEIAALEKTFQRLKLLLPTTNGLKWDVPDPETGEF